MDKLEKVHKLTIIAFFACLLLSILLGILAIVAYSMQIAICSICASLLSHILFGAIFVISTYRDIINGSN